MCVGKHDNALPVVLDTPDAELAAHRRVAVEPDEESFGLAGLLRLHQMTGVVIVFDALQYRNNTIAREVTDVPVTNSVQLGIKHTTGLIYNAKQDWRSMWLFKALQTNGCRYACPHNLTFALPWSGCSPF